MCTWIPSLNRKSDYNFEMIDEPFLSPILLNLAMTSALTRHRAVPGNLHAST